MAKVSTYVECEFWDVWDPLTFLQQNKSDPSSSKQNTTNEEQIISKQSEEIKSSPTARFTALTMKFSFQILEIASLWDSLQTSQPSLWSTPSSEGDRGMPGQTSHTINTHKLSKHSSSLTWVVRAQSVALSICSSKPMWKPTMQIQVKSKMQIQATWVVW